VSHILLKNGCLTANFGVLNWDKISKFAALLAIFGLLPVHSLASEQKLIKISAQKRDGRTEFIVENLQHADVTVTLEMEITNLTASESLPYTTTLSPRAKTTVLSVTPTDPVEDSSWSYTYYATWGNLEVEHDDDYIYHLPYQPGRMFPVSQGFHGKYSHTGGDCYSIDFKMPEGTPVHAAREGVVVGIKNDSERGGSDRKYEWDANYVLIRHSDGTLGHYVHLKKDGCRVQVGQNVKAGEWIGLSGNTGHSTGPHLHFSVFKAQSGKQRQTVPIKYRVNALLAEVLSEGRSYKAF
jgi:murein DD-endopeptidase MepM/ murein hydrolase activator NlpD